MRAMLHRKVCASFACLLAFGLANVAAAATAAAAPAAAAPAEAGVSPVGPDYVIGQRDMLRVIVLRNPEYTAEVPVRPDGKISTPLVNDMQAVGKTASQLAHDIETVLGEYLRSPSVTVIVANAQGDRGQVMVVGTGSTPRALPYRAGMTVLNVIIESGGLSQYAAGNRAKLMRGKGNNKREIKLKLNDLLDKGDMSQNLTIEPEDVIVIPEARF